MIVGSKNKILQIDKYAKGTWQTNVFIDDMFCVTTLLLIAQCKIFLSTIYSIDKNKSLGFISLATVVMQKADVVLRRVCRAWCPSPCAEESLGIYSTADCQIALCPVGIDCNGQHTTFEVWTPIRSPEGEAIVWRWKIILKKLMKTSELYSACSWWHFWCALPLSVIRMFLQRAEDLLATSQTESTFLNYCYKGRGEEARRCFPLSSWNWNIV